MIGWLKNILISRHYYCYGYLERVGKMNRLWLGLADLGSRTDWCQPNVRDQLGTVVKMSWLTPGFLSHLRTVSGMSHLQLGTRMV